jgi:hypothetical protein
MVSRYKNPTMDKPTNLKGMVSRYKTPTMDKLTNLKGMVSRVFFIWKPFLLS